VAGNQDTKDTVKSYAGATPVSSKPGKPHKQEAKAKDDSIYKAETADPQLAAAQPILAPASQLIIAPAPVEADTDDTDTVGTTSATAAVSSSIPPSSPPPAAAGGAIRRNTQSTASIQANNDQPQDGAIKADVLKTQAAMPAAAHKMQPVPNDKADSSQIDATRRTGDIKTASTDAKPDTKIDAGTKPDANQPPPPQAAIDPSQPRPAPAQPVNTNFAVHDITAPQAVQPGTPAVASPAAAQAAQHIRVSAPQPDLPALAVQIAAKSQGGTKQFDIRLDPPELGHVDVRLSIDATGKASAHLTADQPQTLDLLQKDASSLTRALRDAGLDVSQNGLNFSLRQQNGNGFGGDNSGGGGRSFARGTLSLQASRSMEAAGNSISYRAPADGRVDISV
jgi:flagellar hook-length control protein FliK